jgi:hypothetical protein
MYMAGELSDLAVAALKADAVSLGCTALCENACMEQMKVMKPMKSLEPITKGSEAAKRWWPPELGTPSVSGSSNDLRYAYFSGRHRLAVDDGRHIKIYDTGGKPISGFSSSDGKTLTLDTLEGPRKLTSLKLA